MMVMSSALKYAQVTHVIDPHNFHAHIGTEDEFKTFPEHERRWDERGKFLYNKRPELQGVNEETSPGQFILAKSPTTGKWVRAEFKENIFDEVDVYCIDYGTSELVATDAVLRADKSDVGEAAPLAFQCRLGGIKPIANVWISRATTFFSELVLEKRYPCEIVSQDPITSVLILDILIEDEKTGDISPASDILFEENLGIRVALPPSAWKKEKATSIPDDESESEEDIEKELFKKAIGASEEITPYLPSDNLIGDDYKHNVEDSVIFSLQNDLKNMYQKPTSPRRDMDKTAVDAKGIKRSPRARPLGRGRGKRKKMENREPQMKSRWMEISGRSENVDSSKMRVPYYPPPPQVEHRFDTREHLDSRTRDISPLPGLKPQEESNVRRCSPTQNHLRSSQNTRHIDTQLGVKSTTTSMPSQEVTHECNGRGGRLKPPFKKALDVELKIKEDKQLQVRPADLLCYQDCATDTQFNPSRSVETQTDICRESITSSYNSVSQMLHDLDMEEFIPLFKSNAIRDSLLDMSFSDMKELLSEIGLKPGHIWEIKTYRERKKHRLRQLAESRPNTLDMSYALDGLSLQDSLVTRPLSPLPHSATFVPIRRDPPLLTPSSFSISSHENNY